MGENGAWGKARAAWSKSGGGARAEAQEEPETIDTATGLRPQRDSNPCYRRERPVSWASWTMGSKAGEPYGIRRQSQALGALSEQALSREWFEIDSGYGAPLRWRA